MDSPQHHVVIAGTGRAGTSFLVKFLGACGLDVGEGEWHDRARAGLEQSLLNAKSYVVKDPWLFTYVDDIDLSDVVVDVLIIPMRDLSEAATSRLLQERIQMVEEGWHLRPLTDVWGSTPGGAIYSLNRVDQERLLAVGFYRLLRWALSNEIPVLFLDFPRIVEDGDYLIERLAPWLEGHCSVGDAHKAFDSIADLSAIQAESSDDDAVQCDDAFGLDLISAAKHERYALATLLEEHKEAERLSISRLQQELARVVQLQAQSQARLSEMERRFKVSDHERLARDQEFLALEGRLQCSERALAESRQLLVMERQKRESIERTVSWRMTRPLRAIRFLARGEAPQ